MDRHASPGKRARTADAARGLHGQRLPHPIKASVGKHLPHLDAAMVADAVITGIKELVAATRSLHLKGLGTFQVERRRKRVAINPNTGEHLIIPPRKEIRFTADETLEKQL